MSNIIKGFQFIDGHAQCGNKIPRILDPGTVTHDGSILFFRNARVEIVGFNPQMEIESLLIEWAKEHDYFVELDRGGETHNDDDEGEKWKDG